MMTVTIVDGDTAAPAEEAPAADAPAEPSDPDALGRAITRFLALRRWA